MSNLIGIALALALGWNGTNGFDPRHLLLIPEAPGYSVDLTPEFLDWFMQDPTENAELVRYLVRCAVADGKVIKLGELWSFPGELGLAEPLATFDVAGRGKRARILRTETEDDRNTGLWVSACVLAFANTRSYHQFVSIRGNPSNPSAREALKPKPGERWTEGYPEGIFFGNLFDPPAEAWEDLKGFTVSMDLPDDYRTENAGWRPPNPVLGRTLDYDRETRVTQQQGGTVRVAVKLGTYRRRSSAFRTSTNPVDPDYAADAVCTTNQGALVRCPAGGGTPPGGTILRPLFVHLPRLANLEAAQRKPAQDEPFQVFDNGEIPIDKAKQVKHCRECVGPFAYLSARRGPPSPPSRRDQAAKLVNLSKDQALEAVLRFIPKLEAPDLEVHADRPFTAIVRYTCKNGRKEAGCKAKVQLRNASGSGLIDAGDSWPVNRPAVDYHWLQVYPVYLHGEGAKAELRIRIEGMAGVAPELDAVGFVPGEPRCDGQFEPSRKAGAPFMGICRYQ